MNPNGEQNMNKTIITGFRSPMDSSKSFAVYDREDRPVLIVWETFGTQLRMRQVHRRYLWSRSQNKVYVDFRRDAKSPDTSSLSTM